MKKRERNLPPSRYSLLRQFTDPNVAVAHGMAVVLQAERQFLGVRFVGRALAVSCRPAWLDVVLHEHAVVQHCYASGAEELSIFVEARAVKNDVVALPLAGRASSVNKRWILPVHGRGLAVSVGFVFVGIEHLNFIQAHQENAAVATFLAFAFGPDRFGKFDVQLAIAKTFTRVDV